MRRTRNFPLATSPRQAKSSAFSRKISTASSRRLLRGSVTALARLRIQGKDWDVIGASFKEVYARGIDSLRAARADGGPECLHEWRKDAKYLWHDLQVLEPLWPGRRLRTLLVWTATAQVVDLEA